jgi:hypothetical protein
MRRLQDHEVAASRSSWQVAWRKELRRAGHCDSTAPTVRSGEARQDLADTTDEQRRALFPCWQRRLGAHWLAKLRRRRRRGVAGCRRGSLPAVGRRPWPPRRRCRMVGAGSGSAKASEAAQSAARRALTAQGGRCVFRQDTGMSEVARLRIVTGHGPHAGSGRTTYVAPVAGFELIKHVRLAGNAAVGVAKVATGSSTHRRSNARGRRTRRNVRRYLHRRAVCLPSARRRDAAGDSTPMSLNGHQPSRTDREVR